MTTRYLTLLLILPLSGFQEKDPSEKAIHSGLEWLSRHQSSDGKWDCDRFARGCDCDGSGELFWDAGVTGLALMAFLGDGHTHQEGEFHETVKKGMDHLISIQLPVGERAGAIGCVLVDEDKVKPEWVYNHAICTVALCEAYRATGDPALEDPCKRAVDVCLRAQNPHFGWRYGMQSGDNDSSVTSWMVQALWTAKKAGLSVPADALRGAEEWFDRVTSGKGIASYRHPEDEWDPRLTPAMPAAGMLCRFLLGTRKFARNVRGPMRLLMEHLPRWTEDSRRVDLYYWYYGTHAMRRHGGREWKEWRESVEEALIPKQRTGEDVGGSWDPVGRWGTTGGRVYSTAMAVLILEVDKRYDGLR